MWQDRIIAGCNVVLAVALLPSIFSFDKPAWATSLLTAVALTVISVCFGTLKLKWTATSLSVTAVLWYILFFQVL